MTRRAAALLALAAASGCGGRDAGDGRDLEVRVEVREAEVECGRGFPLAVVRAWDRDLEPAPWRDDALAPLVLRPVGVERREDGRRVEETRRFVAHAFSLDEVRVPALRLAAAPRGGGEARSVAGEAFALRVRPVLDPKSPGPPDPPADALRSRGPGVRWWMVVAAAAAAAAGAALLVRGRGSRAAPSPSPAPAATAPPESTTDRALRRLADLGAAAPADETDVLRWHADAAAVLREWLAEGRGVRTAERTTQEILAAPGTARAVGEAGLATLAGVLGVCDLAKFARLAPDAGSRARTLAGARSLVEGAAP